MGSSAEVLGRAKEVLILTRRTHQCLYIGDGPDRIKVEILGVQGNQVRIGITAPKNVPVHREEVWERIRKEMAGDTAEEPEPDGSKA